MAQLGTPASVARARPWTPTCATRSACAPRSMVPTAMYMQALDDAFEQALRSGTLVMTAPVATRTQAPPPLDADARAAFIASSRALTPKYKTELLPPPGAK